MFALRPAFEDRHFFLDKVFAKKYVADLGYRVPKTLSENLSFVIKPKGKSCSKHVVVVSDGSIVLGNQYADIIEELIVDENGQVPPRDFKTFCFGYEAKFVQVIDRVQKTFAYYTADTWEPIYGLCIKPWKDQPKPARLKELTDTCSKLSERFHFPVRVDCYIASDGVVFGEFCLTLGIVGNLTDYGDTLLGQWWEDHFRKKGIEDEFSKKECSFIYANKEVPFI